MITLRLAIPSLLLLAIACGGASQTTPTSADGEKKHHNKEHKELPPALKAFHDEVAPLWHSDKGPERLTKVCASATSLHDKAVAVADKELVDATTGLSAECTKKGPDVEGKFTAVHKQYHVLKERHEK